MHVAGHRRFALTRVEVIVVAAYFVVLLALLAPAVLRVRGEALKSHCADNLQRIGKATHEYHNDHQRLPPGYFGPIPDAIRCEDAKQQCSWVGCLPLLLPYLNADHVYKGLHIDTDLANPGVPWWTDGANVTQATTQLRVFECPADDADQDVTAGLVVAAHAYSGMDGATYYFGGLSFSPAFANKLGRTNYAGVMGALGRGPDRFWGRYVGMMTNRSKLTLGQVTVCDGCSNTLMFGEALGGPGVGEHTTALSWLGVGALPTYAGLGRGDVEPANGGADWYRFSSRHYRVTQFCFGDISVRGLRFSGSQEDWSILQQLAGYKDGE